MFIMFHLRHTNNFIKNSVPKAPAGMSHQNFYVVGIREAEKTEKALNIREADKIFKQVKLNESKVRFLLAPILPKKMKEIQKHKKTNR